MARIFRFLKWIGVLVGALALWGLTSDLSWSDMDLNGNNDGHTDLFELLTSHDFNQSEVDFDGKRCIAYFSHKDGLPFVTKCPEKTLREEMAPQTTPTAPQTQPEAG